MKGLILAAGLGTRLKPWTDLHPKALVPVGGIPMLERVVEKMHKYDIDDITVNCHHFAGQIASFIKDKNWKINLIEEHGEPLETGGAILNAAPLLEGDEPILVHNADILSNADFSTLLKSHIEQKGLATLLVSNRESSRKLIFDTEMKLRGWHSLKTGEHRPQGFALQPGFHELAFSGIYIVSPDICREMRIRGWHGKFSIIDFFIDTLDSIDFFGVSQEGFRLLDIGKPDSLNRANNEFLLF